MRRHEVPYIKKRQRARFFRPWTRFSLCGSSGDHLLGARLGISLKLNCNIPLFQKLRHFRLCHAGAWAYLSY